MKFKKLHIKDGDEEITIDGNILTIKDGNEEIQIDRSEPFESVIRNSQISGNGEGNIVIIDGKVVKGHVADKVPEVLNETYTPRQASSVYVKNLSEDIQVRKYNNGIQVCGDVLERRLEGKQLRLSQLKGDLGVSPKTLIDFVAVSGDVTGAIGSSGHIETTSGDIVVELYKPLEVIASTVCGDVIIQNMHCIGNSYVPMDAKPKGKLILKATAGDIKVNYKKS